MNDEKRRVKPIVGFLKESLCIGGTERSAANISMLLEQDYDLQFILFNGSDVKYRYGGNLIDIKAPPKKSLPGKVINSFIRYEKVKKVLKQKKISVLYEFISIENLLSHVSYNGIKRIISARDFGKIKRETEMFHKALSKASAMVCNSEYIKNYYTSMYPQDKDKVFAVYNVIDAEDILRQSDETVETEFLDFIGKHRKNISATGRFCKEKGFEYLLEAFAKSLPKLDLGLVLIGDGAYKEKYRKIIQDLGIEDRVYFTGYQNNPYKYMAKSDMFVLSSLSEGFPNVLAEAMSLGLPVIATNCYSGPAEILRNDCDYEAVTAHFEECDYGIITPRITDTDNENAINELSGAIEYLAVNDELMQKYSALAKERAAEFSPEAAAKKFNMIFERLLNDGKNK